MNLRTYPSSLLLLLLGSSAFAVAQIAMPVAPSAPETLVVLGSPVPVPLAESTASISILPVEENTLRLASEQDLLRQDSSLVLEQRGAGGGQADIVLRGGSFEQALVLVNGFRIDDSQTAHHNLDLPIPFEAMHSIEVLHGAGSTLHGADALSGVIDFLTAAPAADSLELRSGAGSFGENEQALLAALVRKRLSSRLTAERNFSTGFMPDRDYRNEDSSLENWISSRIGLSDLLFAASDRSFGANQFYGPYDSWERTKGWFAAARQELDSRTTASFGYRRHTDEFILLRDNPSVYENNHVDSSWQASLRRTVSAGNGNALLAGLESDGDSIRSSNLGDHARNRAAGYADLDLHPAKRRWSLSAGAREEVFSGGARTVFVPHAAASLRIHDAIKLRASGGYGFRIPTYTDLYYSDPTTLGNPNLKPESAWSGEGGVDWNASAKLTLSATGFYARQHDTIDYLRASSSAPWQAANLNGLRFAGIETAMTWMPVRTERVEIGYTRLEGAQGPLGGMQSEYALNYPVLNFHATWTSQLGRALTVTNSLQLTKPDQQPGIAPWNRSPYPVWNLALTHEHGPLRPYLRLSNLSNTGYQEINGVAMPGRAVMGGVSFQVGR